MADVVDCLHINDITVMCTLDSEDDLADRKDTMLLARVQIDNILLDEMEPCLPIIYEGMGGRPAARWELGSLQIPTDCCPFTLIITTTRHFEIFRFEIRGSDGMWDTEGVESEEIHLRFRAQVSLYHPSSRFHRGCYTTPGSDVVRRDIPPAEPWDERTGFPHWLLGFLPAELLLHLGMQHYFRAQSSPGDNVYLNHALAAFERALEDPNIDPDLSQVLETIIPFLYCREQGYSSCLDIALQVLQTFPGLPKAQLNAQLFLQLVVFDVMKRFEWHDHVPLAIRLITGQLKLLLHSASLATWKLFAGWVIFAYRLAPSAKEVLPLMDLMVDFHYGFLTSKGWESLPMMRATVYFMHAIEPGGPSLGVTLGAAEFVMHLLPAGHSPHLGLTFGLAFIDWSIIWLLDVLARDSDESKPCKDRILSFIAWQLSNLPLHQELQGSLRVIQSRLRGNMCIYASERVKAAMSRPPILDDNDNQFIEAILQDLRHQRSGKVIPAEYPKGAAELQRQLHTHFVSLRLSKCMNFS
ncbi:hypothetical protein BDN72DRAFT_132241 [Pluteus cervinus]|uniref:Uncharacterized protein n=1 Tax=Pluteus cervinus TaxID=181527 RepID=A0ACD3AMG9_9AGAR|nr:hypothetical protein BDN72DRAFT_132241 [Pluteus cervinus]